HRLFEQAPVVFNLGAELLRVGPPVREAVDAGSPVAARAVVAGPAGDLAEEVADLVLDDRAEPAAEAQGRVVLEALHPLAQAVEDPGGDLLGVAVLESAPEAPGQDQRGVLVVKALPGVVPGPAIVRGSEFGDQGGPRGPGQVIGHSRRSAGPPFA